MADKREFSTNAVHAGTQHIEGAVNTPIFQSSTYKLTDERYAGWAAGAQHTLLYARLSSVNSEAVVEKICALEGAEDGELFASGMAAISTTTGRLQVARETLSLRTERPSALPFGRRF